MKEMIQCQNTVGCLRIAPLSMSRAQRWEMCQSDGDTEGEKQGSQLTFTFLKGDIACERDWIHLKHSVCLHLI